MRNFETQPRRGGGAGAPELGIEVRPAAGKIPERGADVGFQGGDQRECGGGGPVGGWIDDLEGEPAQGLAMLVGIFARRGAHAGQRRHGQAGQIDVGGADALEREADAMEREMDVDGTEGILI